MSRFYIEHALATPDEVKDTLLHEIAHALVGSQHQHNTTWRDKAIEIGCKGNRCVSFCFSTASWHIACPCGAIKLYRHVVQKRTLKKKCVKCGCMVSAKKC